MTVTVTQPPVTHYRSIEADTCKDREIELHQLYLTEKLVTHCLVYTLALKRRVYFAFLIIKDFCVIADLRKIIWRIWVLAS